MISINTMLADKTALFVIFACIVVFLVTIIYIIQIRKENPAVYKTRKKTVQFCLSIVLMLFMLGVIILYACITIPAIPKEL